VDCDKVTIVLTTSFVVESHIFWHFWKPNQQIKKNPQETVEGISKKHCIFHLCAEFIEFFQEKDYYDHSEFIKFKRIQVISWFTAIAIFCLRNSPNGFMVLQFDWIWWILLIFKKLNSKWQIQRKSVPPPRRRFRRFMKFKDSDEFIVSGLGIRGF